MVYSNIPRRESPSSRCRRHLEPGRWPTLRSKMSPLMRMTGTTPCSTMLCVSAMQRYGIQTDDGGLPIIPKRERSMAIRKTLAYRSGAARRRDVLRLELVLQGLQGVLNAAENAVQDMQQSCNIKLGGAE